MAGWPSSNLNSRFDEMGERMMDLMFSHKSSVDLMQNCDLPPPLKVFSGPDKTVVSPMYKTFSFMDQEDGKEGFDEAKGGNKSEKTELLKALQLSQTRAREAERQAAGLAKERNCLANAFLQESLQTFAYRQWVRLLETQVFKLRKQCQGLKQQHCCSCHKPHGEKKLPSEDDGGDTLGFRQGVVFAICISLAGLGVALGCRYLH